MLSLIRKNTAMRVSASLAVAALLVVSTTACGKGKGGKANISIPGVTGPTVSVVNGVLTMSLVVNNVSVDGGVSLALPNMPNSYLQIGPDLQSNGLLISLGIASQDLKVLNINLLDPLSLPGGRPLPGISAGWMPGLAVQVPKLHNMVIYVGMNTSSKVNLVGVFVPVNIGMKGSIISARFYDAAGDDIGLISLVGQDANGENAGFLLLINTAPGTVVANAAGMK